MFAPDEIKGVPLDKQSFINGVNKPFMELFLLSRYLYNTCIIDNKRKLIS